MTSDNYSAKRPTEHPIERPPDTDPQQGHEHPEAYPPARVSGGRPDGKQVNESEQDAHNGDLDPPVALFSKGHQPGTFRPRRGRPGQA